MEVEDGDGPIIQNIVVADEVEGAEEDPNRPMCKSLPSITFQFLFITEPGIL